MADFGKLNFAVSFNPQTAFPLDARTLFYSYDDAVAAAAEAKRAGSSETVYYYGMRITVVNMEKETARQYVIQPGGRLLGIAFSGESGSGSDSEGGVSTDQLGDTLIIDAATGKIEVNTAKAVEDDNMLPVTSDAVFEYVDQRIDSSLGVVGDFLATI